MIIKRVIKVIFKKIVLIVISAFIFALLSGIVSAVMPINYVTKSQLMVVTYDKVSENVFDEYKVSQELARTFSSVAQTNSILSIVNEQLGTNYDMKIFEDEAITVTTTNEIITITVSNKDPKQAKLLADALANALIKYVKESVFPEQDIIKIINNAYEPYRPGFMYYLINALKGGVGGVALAVVYVLIMDMIKAPVRYSDEIKHLLNIEVIGEIKYNKQIADLKNNKYLSEEFKFLRVNLRNNTTNKDKVIAFLSPGNKTGKSVLCSNIGACLAAGDKKVLLIDCNFYKPDLSTLFDCNNKQGIFSYNNSDPDYREFISDTFVNNLYIIPAGNEISIGSLGSDNINNLLNDLRNDFDYIFIDTPNTLTYADAGEILCYTDKAIIVAEYEKTSVSKVEKVSELVELSKSKVAGIIINKSK